MTTEPKPLPIIPGPLILDPQDPEVRWITGRTCLFCGGIAQVLRRLGHQIECRAEDEQSAVILWMLALYRDHGAGWKEAGTAYLKRAKDPETATPQPAAAPA